MVKKAKELVNAYVFFSLQYAVYMVAATIMVARGDEDVVGKIIDLTDEKLD